MTERSLSVSDALPMEDVSKAGTQLVQGFSASPNRLSGLQKRCSEEGTTSTKENVEQRNLLRAPFLSKGKEKMRNIAKGEDRAGFMGFVGCSHSGSSVTVHPSYPATSEKGLNSVGYCGMMVVENFEVSSHHFS